MSIWYVKTYLVVLDKKKKILIILKILKECLGCFLKAWHFAFNYGNI